MFFLQHKINVPNRLDTSLSVFLGYWWKLNDSFRKGTWLWDKWIKARLIPTSTLWEQSYAIAHWSRPGFNDIYQLKVEAILIWATSTAKSFKLSINIINNWIDLLEKIDSSLLITLKSRFVVGSLLCCFGLVWFHKMLKLEKLISKRFHISH